MKREKIWIAAALLAVASPTAQSAYSQPAPMNDGAPPLAPNLARFYFYRAESYSAMAWTAVFLNGAQVGDSAPGTYFHRDVAAGTYKIALRTEERYTTQFQTVAVAAGTTNYVRIYAFKDWSNPGTASGSGFGFVGLPYAPEIFGDQIVDPGTALREMAGLTPKG